MTVIAASSVKLATLVDGTLRLICDIEPANAQKAFALFAAPGTSMALAALKDGHAAKSDAPAEPRGELCMWTVMRCRERSFWKWIETQAQIPIADAEQAARYVRAVCGVTSRRHLDLDPAAAEALHERIRKPYSAWLKTQ